MITSPNHLANDADKAALAQEVEYQRLKQRIHGRLVESLDLADVQRIDDAMVQEEISRLAWQFIDEDPTEFDAATRSRLHVVLKDELFGVGPLEPLLADPTVSDILVNDPHEVFVERRGQLFRTDVVFADRSHLMRIIQRVV